MPACITINCNILECEYRIECKWSTFPPTKTKSDRDFVAATDRPAREPSMSAQPFGSALLVSGLYDLEPLRNLPLGSLMRLSNAERALG